MRVHTVRARGRRGIGLTWRVAMIVAALLAALTAGAAGAFSVAGGVVGAVPTSILPAQPGALRWDGHHPLTILLMGADRPQPGSSPTDAMVLASYRPQQRTLTFLALPTNLWVTVPGYGQTTLRQAAADGGPQLALTVAESVTHAVIPWYAMAGTDAGRQIIDSFGSLRLSRHLLNGDAALHYLAAPDPVSAMMRERAVILAFQRQELQPQNLFKVPAAITAAGGGLRTNLPYDQIAGLVRIVASLSPRQVRGTSLDVGSGAVTAYRAGGRDVLLPDLNRIAALTSAVFPRPIFRRHIAVLNGAGLTGAAAQLRGWLKQMGLPARGIGTAASPAPRTEVVVNTSFGNAAALARAAAALLQVPVIRRSLPAQHEPVVVLIGQNYQYPGQ